MQKRRNNSRRDVYGDVRVLQQVSRNGVLKVLVENMVTGAREYRVLAV